MSVPESALVEDGTLSPHAASARVSHVPVLLLGALLLSHLCANLWFLYADNHVIRTDEETHMLTARDYYEELALKEHDSALQLLIGLGRIHPRNPAHPPLLPIMGAAMACIFGYDTDVFAFVNTIMFLLLILGCYAISRQFLDPWQSLFAAFVVSFTPSIFNASRYFMTDYPATVVVVWSLYAMIRSDFFMKRGWVVFFAVLNGLGILTRTVTFVYYLTPAVLLVICGLVRLLVNRPEQSSRWRALGRLAGNCVLTVVVTVAVFAPWYFHNLEPFYNFWVIDKPGASGGPLTIAQQDTAAESPEPATAGEARSEAPSTPQLVLSTAAENRSESVHENNETAKWLLNPRVPWIRYPVHVINNNLFLPLAILAALGCLLAILRRRFRGMASTVLIVAILGSYVLMTLLIKYSVARYALPVAPALALLAALPLIALRPRAIRIAGMMALGAYLLYCYGNLTFFSYARLWAPIVLDEHIQYLYEDPGLTVCKDTLTYSNSYSCLGAAMHDTYRPDDDNVTIRNCNYKERLFLAMVKEENRRKALTGPDANYIKLGSEMRGMELEERHFWPEPNPFLKRGFPVANLPRRRLTSVLMADTPERTLSKLAQADYVVYGLYEDSGETERRWLKYLNERGFQQVDRFRMERFGFIMPRIYGVMSRKEGVVIAIDSMSDLDALNRFELYQLKTSVDFPNLPEPMRAYANERFKKLIAEAGYPDSVTINEYVTFIGADVIRAEEDIFQFWFVFHVDQKIPEDWRIFLHGKVSPEHISMLPPEKQGQDYHDWNFDPDPSTDQWPAGDYVMITRSIRPQPIPYMFRIGFFRRGPGHTGNLGSVFIGTVDFGKYVGLSATSEQ